MTRTQEARETDLCGWWGYYSEKAVIFFFPLAIAFCLPIKKNDAKPGCGAVCTLVFCVAFIPGLWQCARS